MVSERIDSVSEVTAVYAPESWARYFHNSGCRIVPTWMTLEDLRHGREVAAGLHRLLGKAFPVRFQPNSCFDDEDDCESMGHVIALNYRPALDAAFDLRDEDLHEQVANWLASIARQFNQARHRLLADRPRTAADDEPVVAIFEVVDVATGRILHRSLTEADCLDFQRAASTRCEVRSRDALLCSARATTGGAA